MTKHDLENLKHLPVPPPREAAKTAAIDAALAAFDTSFIGATGSSAEELAGCTEIPTKGKVLPLRQTETSTRKRSFIMRISSRQNLALAASLAALVIAAPLAFRITQHEVQGTFGNAATKLDSRGAGTAAQPAPAQIEIVRVEPAPRQAGEQNSNIALVEKVKPEIDARPTATAQGMPSEDKPVTAGEGRVVDLQKNVEGLIAKDHNAREQITPPLTIDRQDLARKGADPGAPPSNSMSPIDGLGAVGGTGAGALQIPPGLRNDREAASSTVPAAIASLERDASARGRIAASPDGYKLRRLADELEFKKAEAAKPHSWMGGDTEIQPQIIQQENRDKFDAKEINPVKQVASDPVSTFSIDVDTASYSFVRRALNAGHLPPKDAVRVEEMINYFPYSYPAPETAESPFKTMVSVFQSPWNAKNKLVHVAIKGYDLKNAERPRANLVFLMDVSGSMQPSDRLPLVKNAFRLLVDRLKPDDTVGIVTYASGSGIALEPTKVSEKTKILAAIDRLGAGGSTAGAAGIADAYRLAEAGFDKNAINRVILATDGDFNVGITDQSELKGFIERKRQSGIFLSILGVGQGNHNDALMQTLAQNGNGTAAYVDTLNEARKVLVDESTSTLFTIAKDVKVQIEWNPTAVSEYRLIGYETRNLRREDFNNDRVDAGDIGSGHTVTAIYEVTPVGAPKLVEDLRYGKKVAAESAAAPATPAKDAAASNELGFLKLRYKRPNEDTSQLVSMPIPLGELIVESFSKNFREHQATVSEAQFSIAVAAFGQMLKGEPYMQGYTFDDVLALAQAARGDDLFGYRAEFLNLVRLAKSARP